MKPFNTDTTVRWSCREGDLVLWASCGADAVLQAKSDPWTLPDIWGIKDGQYVMITNRVCDLPNWFSLRPEEVGGAVTTAPMDRDRLNTGDLQEGPLDGPNIWRVQAGDRIAWVRPGLGPQATVLAILRLDANALVLGEALSSSLQDHVAFGALPKPMPPGAVDAARAVLHAIRSHGIPRTISTEWRFGV